MSQSRPSPLPAIALAAAIAAGCSVGAEDGGGTGSTFADPGTGGGPGLGTGTASSGGASGEDREGGAGEPRSASIDAGRALDALERLGAHALVALARRLETGAALGDAELACLSAYDPSLGEPLAALACDVPLDVTGTPVSLQAVSMRTDDACLETLGDSARTPADVVAGCDWTSASMRLRTQWIAPSRDDAYAGRPRPLAGATFDYADSPPALVATSLESRLTGSFTCTADLAADALDQSGELDCAAGMQDFANRLQGFADALEGAPPL